jgi:hypothetical protein
LLIPIKIDKIVIKLLDDTYEKLIPIMFFDCSSTFI